MLPALCSLVIFITCMLLIFTERVDRTIAALAGAVSMVVAGLVLGFYPQEQAIARIDFNTTGLLFGMMVLVALLEPTGFFQFLAVWVARLSAGKPLRLLIYLGAVTSLLSMFLNNVTTVILVAPVTILICEILGLDTRPYLMAEALLSDTGGVATLIGDPPNILIASAAGLSFNDFLIHSLPLVLVVSLVALAMLAFFFRRELSQAPSNLEALAELDPREALKDGRTARRVLLVIALAILLFMLEELLHITPALIAFGAAAWILLWVRPSIEATLKRVQWDVLIFFSSLFILIGGLESAGILAGAAQFIARAQHLPPLVLGVIILWGVALLSAVVDNVPITIALIPVIQGLGQSGIPTQPLWWALVFGAGLGGNGTIIGSSANLVIASLSEKTHTPITARLWNRQGLPIMLATCLVASLLYAAFYPFFGQ